jgi:hypothetical protein
MNDSDNLRPACSSCQSFGIACEYIKQDASTLDPASLRILEQLSTIEGLVRDIHRSPALSLLTPDATSLQQPRPDIRSPGVIGAITEQEHVESTLNLDIGVQATTDKVLEWPIFRQQLLHLEQFRYTDFRGRERYTYLSDHLFQNVPSNSRPLPGSAWESSSSINISLEQSGVERLVDQFFRRVNIKNPLLTRQEANIMSMGLFSIWRPVWYC